MSVSVTRLFRALALVAALVHTWLWLSPWLGPELLDGYNAWLLNFDSYGASIPYSPVLYWCLLTSWLLVYAGLFFYVPAARAGLLCLIAVTLALGMGWGIRVLPPHEAVVTSLLAVIDGALVTMAYLPPIRMEFKRHR